MFDVVVMILRGIVLFTTLYFWAVQGDPLSADASKICQDLHPTACETLASKDLCDKLDHPQLGNVSANCRKTCSICEPGVILSMQRNLQFHGGHAHKGKNKALLSSLPIDPHALHRDFLQGKVSDDLSIAANPMICEIPKAADKELLSHITVNTSIYSQPGYHGGVKIFCGIYTIESKHSTSVQATRLTWAKHCDGFIAFSNKTDPAYSAMEIKHAGDEAYMNMWQKVRSIWKFVYENLYDHFDYFVLGGDDMFYIIANLRAYLNSDEIKTARTLSKGLYLGRHYLGSSSKFVSGGPGYILEKKALKILYEHLEEPRCFPNRRHSMEDVLVAVCLRESPENILPYSTRDTLGRERFHPFTPSWHLNYRAKSDHWYTKLNPDLKVGFDCCSEESISFHYVNARMMYNFHNFVHHCKDKEKKLNSK